MNRPGFNTRGGRGQLALRRGDVALWTGVALGVAGAWACGFAVGLGAPSRAPRGLFLAAGGLLLALAGAALCARSWLGEARRPWAKKLRPPGHGGQTADAALLARASRKAHTLPLPNMPPKALGADVGGRVGRSAGPGAQATSPSRAQQREADAVLPQATGALLRVLAQVLAPCQVGLFDYDSKDQLIMRAGQPSAPGNADVAAAGQASAATPGPLPAAAAAALRAPLTAATAPALRASPTATADGASRSDAELAWPAPVLAALRLSARALRHERGGRSTAAKASGRGLADGAGAGPGSETGAASASGIGSAIGAGPVEEAGLAGRLRVAAVMEVPRNSHAGHVWGLLAVLRPEARPWSEADVALIDGVAAQLALAWGLEQALRSSRRHLQRLERIATTDGLTELVNQRHFAKLFDLQLARARRYNRRLSLIFLDIDHFKAVNDTHGHQAGDEVLKKVAEVLRGTARCTDTVARLGGEEFAVLMEETGAKGAERYAERIRQALGREVFTAQGGAFHKTCSLGVATFPEHGEQARDLMARADEALYFAKRTGRNRTVIYRADATTRESSS